MSARRTIAREIKTSGITLHSGRTVAMRLSPAAPGAGIRFRRSDLGAEIPALYDRVSETRLGTVITEGAASAGVIEHLMAAVAGAEIDDLLVTLDGPEPPILDGDALSFLTLIESAGSREQDALRRRAIRVLRLVTVEQGEARASLSPADHLIYDCEIDFPNPAIGRQAYRFAFSPAAFRTEIAPARTFGFLRELETLNKMNLARGASLENTLALSDTGVVNREKLRFDDEFVRHKILDAIGDMALAGAPLIGRFQGIRSGHATNNALLRALFADPANFEYAEL